MAVDVVIYHNPACGTSRNTLAMIRNAGIEPHVVEYLKTPPSRVLLVELIDRAGITPRDLLREKGTPYPMKLYRATHPGRHPRQFGRHQRQFLPCHQRPFDTHRLAVRHIGVAFGSRKCHLLAPPPLAIFIQCQVTHDPADIADRGVDARSYGSLRQADPGLLNDILGRCRIAGQPHRLGNQSPALTGEQRQNAPRSVGHRRRMGIIDADEPRRCRDLPPQPSRPKTDRIQSVAVRTSGGRAESGMRRPDRASSCARP